MCVISYETLSLIPRLLQASRDQDQILIYEMLHCCIYNAS